MVKIKICLCVKMFVLILFFSLFFVFLFFFSLFFSFNLVLGLTLFCFKSQYRKHSPPSRQPQA